MYNCASFARQILRYFLRGVGGSAYVCARAGDVRCGFGELPKKRFPPMRGTLRLQKRGGHAKPKNDFSVKSK